MTWLVLILQIDCMTCDMRTPNCHGAKTFFYQHICTGLSSARGYSITLYTLAEGQWKSVDSSPDDHRPDKIRQTAIHIHIHTDGQSTVSRRGIRPSLGIPTIWFPPYHLKSISSHLTLRWPLVITSHFLTLYAYKHICHQDKQTWWF